MIMAPSHSNVIPLSGKHQNFNKRVQDAIINQPLLEREFAKDNNDLDNLMKIDIASHKKDIDYILSVLKSDDMLYISRAIKQSPWIVDDHYANIINPAFLNEHLFPNMKTKASIKLLKHIRHYLKNESRVEEFYKNETNDKAAVKWLSRCSIPFIETNIEDHMSHITDFEFKRLCERSVTVFEAAIERNNGISKLRAASFLLHTHPNKYLDLFESMYQCKFGPTATRLIMKKNPDRVINNFLLYVNYIHIPTFIQNIDRKQIKDFLFELANMNDKTCPDSMYNFKTMKQFIERMPKEEQYEFVKNVFLDKNIMEIDIDTLKKGTKMFAIKKICSKVWSRKPLYHWYVFAPFNIAFNEIKKLVQIESNINEKYSMYKVLLKCVADNTDLLELLKHYSINSTYDDIGMKLDFVDKLISVTEIYKNDQEIWKEFTDIINSMDMTESHNQTYIQTIILHDILHGKQVAEAIEEKLYFNTFESYRGKLNEDEQNKVFKYLYNYFMKKVQDHNIETEKDFSEAIEKVEHLLCLLLGWDKKLSDYPFALQKIKELIDIRKVNSWEINMSSLYNMNKSWKRYMFEESIALNPSQKVFVNALKHDPGLLVRYKSEVDAMICDDKISLNQLLKKIRIYWPESLAESWTESYVDRLDKVGDQKALTRSLCTILPQETLIDIIKKYAPAQPKIDWNNTNEVILGLQRCFAKNMHIARPQPSADIILLYAKGDFLQYALPSLHAIYYNMGHDESQEHIPKLLNSPVSIQKHGLRFAFMKLKHDELKSHLFNVWQTSKNISIRAVTFGLLFDLMCKTTEIARAEELWEIIEVFIDNLTFKEDQKIYEKLLKVNDVPETIQPKFLVKSYNFLKTLLPHTKIEHKTYENGIRNLAYYTTKIMEFTCPEFVANIITEHLDVNFWKDSDNLDNNMLSVTSSYLLCAKDEVTQNNKYEKVLLPLIKRAMNQWDELHEDKYFIRRNFQNLLDYLYSDLKEYVVDRNMIVPTKMFQNIQKELEILPVQQNYIVLRMWKLKVKMVETIAKNDEREDWEQICTQAIPEFGTFCLEVLKEDVKAYFPCIYVLFEKALRSAINVLGQMEVLQIYEILLSDEEFIQAYLLVLNMVPGVRACYYSDDNIRMEEHKIRQLIRDHSSVEVKIHYHCRFSGDNLLGI